jgi:hypothetical protein
MEMVQKKFTVNFLVSEHIRKKWCDFSLFPNGNGSKKGYCKFPSVHSPGMWRKIYVNSLKYKRL